MSQSDHAIEARPAGAAATVPAEPRFTEREFLERLQNRLSGTFIQMFSQMINPPTAGMIGPPTGFGHFEPTPPSEEDAKFVDAIIKDMEPEIQSQTAALIRTELREAMLLGGNLGRIKELLRSGRMPKIVRKRERGRDPLYLQFGDGVKDEIEEFRILG